MSQFHPYGPVVLGGGFTIGGATLASLHSGGRRSGVERSGLSSSRDPLVVQFWLLGLDAAHGHLLERGFRKAASPRGSSVYTLDGLTLHSRGLWLELPQGTVQYLRPRQAFYRLAPDTDPFQAGSRPPPDAQHLTRVQGLELALSALLEHERWTAQQCGPDWRSGQLSRRLPPPVRRHVPAWEIWMAGRHLNAWTRPQSCLILPECPPVRLVGGADSPFR